MSLREGDRVLVPDREHAYLPATVVQRTEAGLDVRLVDGSTHTLAAAAASQVVLADPLALQGSDDMVRFNLLTEASIVHNLRVRYEREAIYTAVGPILISVNPLRQLEGGQPQQLGIRVGIPPLLPLGSSAIHPPQAVDTK